MATANFKVKNGLTVGNLSLTASTGNISSNVGNITLYPVAGSHVVVTGNLFLNGTDISAAINTVSNAVSVVSAAQLSTQNAISNEISVRAAASAALETHINTVSNAVSVVSAAVNTVSNAVSVVSAAQLSTWNKVSAILTSSTTFSGATYTFSNSTAATSNSTGAVVVTGGVGASGNIYTGTNMGIASSGTLKVYQSWNSTTSSIDTIFV